MNASEAARPTAAPDWLDAPGDPWVLVTCSTDYQGDGRLAATAIAFVIAEGAKLQKSPIERTSVSKVFSPDATIIRIRSGGKVIRYGSKVATVKFQLRSAQTLQVWVEDHHGNQVASLLPSRHFRKGQVVTVVWDGTEPDGLTAPDGIYRPVVSCRTGRSCCRTRSGSTRSRPLWRVRRSAC